MTTRRRMLTAVAANALLGTFAAPGSLRNAYAQTKSMPVVGFLSLSARNRAAEADMQAFYVELASLGWKTGANIIVEERWADGYTEQVPRLAEELARKKPALILSTQVAGMAAVLKATADTPVVSMYGGDVVAAGFAKSLARPGGRVTGTINLVGDSTVKQMELLLEAMPKLQRIGLLGDSANSAHDRIVSNVRRSAAPRGVEIRVVTASKPEECGPAVERLAKEGAQAMILMPTGWFSNAWHRIFAVAMSYRMPVAATTSYSELGALLSYSADRADSFRRAAHYVDRILKGATPGDLPIEQPRKFNLVVNLKTARVLGITIPQSVLVQATKVIE